MEQISVIIYTTWEIVKSWWWVLLPIILYRPCVFFWLYWRRERWASAQKFILLEIKMPKEILKPLRAMEQVFSSFWGNLYDPADWWETWVEGKGLLSLSLEIVSFGGEPHFFVRTHDSRRNAIESSIYSQYPDAEISIVDDYAKYVPQDVPNKNWDIWGADYELIKPDVYPLKTYSKFFEERPEIAKEEKRIDPVATLLEGLGTLKSGEQLWIQIVATPITGSDFISRGREIADKLAKRPEKVKPKPIILEAAEEVITGKMPGEEEKKREEEEKRAVMPPEMKLTPGEREIIAGVEEKIAKRCFFSYFRFIYLARRDVYFGGAKAIPFGFFQQFATENLNAPKPFSKTITKIHRYPILDLVRSRRLFVRKRRLFLRYLRRFPPLFPKPGGIFMLNIEELATIFHFPGRAVAPAPFVPRVESKRGEAPPGLPME